MKVGAFFVAAVLAAALALGRAQAETVGQSLSRSCAVYGTVRQMEADANRMPEHSKQRSDELREAAHQLNECIPDIKSREMRDLALVYHAELIGEAVRTVGDALNYLPVAMAEIDPVFKSSDRPFVIKLAHTVKDSESSMLASAQRQFVAAMRAMPTPPPIIPPPPSYSSPGYSAPAAPPPESADCDSDSIDAVARDGKVITTLSGATFIVPDINTVTTSLWLATSDLEVCSTDNPRVFMLINKEDDNEHVYATRVDQ